MMQDEQKLEHLLAWRVSMFQNAEWLWHIHQESSLLFLSGKPSEDQEFESRKRKMESEGRRKISPIARPFQFGLEHSVPGTGLEPAHPFEYYNLNIARLPISPSGQLNL